jgi:hypothetical protein
MVNQILGVSFAVALSFGSIFAFAGAKDEKLVSTTATIESVDCISCVRWKGNGDAERIADRLNATVSSPAASQQLWHLPSNVSFTASEEGLAHEHVVLRHSHLKSL